MSAAICGKMRSSILGDGESKARARVERTLLSAALDLVVAAKTQPGSKIRGQPKAKNKVKSSGQECPLYTNRCCRCSELPTVCTCNDLETRSELQSATHFPEWEYPTPYPSLLESWT